MGYFVRVLSTSPDCVPEPLLQAALREAGSSASLRLEAGAADDWGQLVLSHPDDWPIASIERNPVVEGELGAAEMAAFAQVVANDRPESAARWLLDYFPRVRCVYAIQVLSGTEHDRGWESLDAVRSALWRFAPSIFQADDEGFSDEAGYHILWQFRGPISGEYGMGVLVDGRWRHFRMKLGSAQHRKAFLEGRVPEGVKVET